MSTTTSVSRRHRITALLSAAFLLGTLMAATPAAMAQEPTCDDTMFGEGTTEGGIHTLGVGLISGTVHELEEDLPEPVDTIVHEVNCGLVVQVECVVDGVLMSDTDNCTPADDPSQVADLGITKDGSSESPVVGTELTFFIVVTNHGPDATDGVTVTDPLPDQVSFVSAETSQGICTEVDSTVTCDIGLLGADGTATVDIVVDVDEAGEGSNTARVSGTEEDPNPANDEATFGFTAVPAPDPIKCGDTVTGHVVLTHDLDCELDGLFVGAAGTTIDLNGRFIRGQRDGTGISLAEGVQADRVLVTRGIIRNFTNGIVFGSGFSATLRNLSLVGNAERGAFVVADRVTVNNVRAAANGDGGGEDGGPGDGLFVRSFGPLGGGRLLVADSSLRSNRGHGAVLAGDAVTVVNTVTRNNGQTGLVLSGDVIGVRDSGAHFNGTHGVQVRSNSLNFRSNLLMHNGRTGLRSVADRAGINENVARFNKGLGISSIDRPNVGGSNIARDNNEGRFAQCHPLRLCTRNSA